VNRLGRETSPYLLQHAEDPVDWYPWGDEALARARSEDKPVLLSVGYSACHWCHVMAHESFKDPGTAQVMNELFVNIKVDREERPDIDRIYQSAHHLITRRPGGWPLTMFLTPDELVPFFGGTYFPREPRYGIPSFTEVLTGVAEYYHRQPAELRQQGPALREALSRLDAPSRAGGEALDAAPFRSFRDALAARFDAEFGGFGDPPKFPHPTNLELLLRCWWHTAADARPDVHALYMCALTLQRMAEGGIYDQLGGGFCRYSVDRSWSIPHFEKMLYDNGLLLALYCRLFQIGGDENFRRVAAETADWLLRDMRSPEGGFYSSLDADAEGEEGRFYAWTPGQVRLLLSREEFAVLAPRFGLDREPNFEQYWHLRVCEGMEAIAAHASMPLSTAWRSLDDGRAKLLASRNGRVWPGRDEKILGSWNALVIRALAIAGRVLGRPDLVAAAGQALDFVRNRMVVDGRLCATWKDGRARFNAYLDDHAFLLDATLELLQARWRTEHLTFATWLAEQLLTRFQDEAHGGFFFTASDHERLLHRSRSISDEATPSGSAVAALALGRLGHLLGEPLYLRSAEATVRTAWAATSEFPHGHATMLAALDELLSPPEIVVVRGTESQIGEWAVVAAAAFAPRRLVFAIPAGTKGLPGSLAARAATSGTVAYLCRGAACSAPLRSIEEMAAALSETDPPDVVPGS
jgi:hypothetical protein